MKNMSMGTVAFVALIAAAGCADDEPEDTGTVNEDVAAQSASAAFSAAEIAVSGDGQSAAFALVGVGTSALGMVTPAGGGAQPMHAGAQGLGSVSLPQGGGCTCTDTQCTFDACDNGAGLQLSGSISWSDTTLDCDYSVSGNQAGATYAFSVFCDLDYSDTSLDGELHSTGDIDVAAAGANGASSWDSQLTFNDVTYAAGQPSGGSMDVSASVTTGGETYTANQTLTF